MDVGHQLLRHFVATLAYRTDKALRGAPEGFPDFRAGSGVLAQGAEPRDVSLEALFQGPLSDAMTHAGQLALLRRLAGSPVEPENFVVARIDPDALER